MQNTYQLKQYRAWTYIKTINPDTIDSSISFTAQQNAWQGEMRLLIVENFENNDYVFGDIIRLYVFSDLVQWHLIYTGYIESINQSATTNEQIEIRLLWVATLLKSFFYRVGASRTFNKTDTPLNILTQILANFNTDSWLSFAIDDSFATPTSINIDFNFKSCYDAIVEVMWFVDWYWYIDQNYKLQLRQYETKHSLTYGKNISKLDISSNINIFNRLYLNYIGWPKTYNDVASQTAYWIREKTITNNDIKNTATADGFATQWLSDNANPNKTTTLDLTDQYEGSWDSVRDDTDVWVDGDYWLDIIITWGTETIEPWDWIRIQNFYTEVTGVVDRLSYNDWFISINLDKSYNFIDLIKE